jgi:hypothetical protein
MDYVLYMLLKYYNFEGAAYIRVVSAGYGRKVISIVTNLHAFCKNDPQNLGDDYLYFLSCRVCC